LGKHTHSATLMSLNRPDAWFERHLLSICCEMDSGKRWLSDLAVTYFKRHGWRPIDHGRTMTCSVFREVEYA
jgi:hypothetical protein